MGRDIFFTCIHSEFVGLMDRHQTEHDWYDYKRTDQPELKKNINGKEYILPAHDPRYTLDLPKEAKASNPLL